MLLSLAAVCMTALDVAAQTSPDNDAPTHIQPFPIPADIDEGEVIIDAMPADPRRTDGGGNVLPAGIDTPPDLLHVAYGRWRPDEAPAVQPIPPTFVFDEYDGHWSQTGEFLRVDLLFAGLINPPGPTANGFDPQRYGPSPLYGFVEFDIDRNVNTGGEIDEPYYRYNANVARFGGRPKGAAYADRIALDGSPADSDPFTPPYIDRSGEDAHLAIFGDSGRITRIDDVVAGGTLCGGASGFNCDGSETAGGAFAAGDVWDVWGHFFGLAHGYLAYKYGSGHYEHLDRLRFQHDIERNMTQVSFLYPLTQRAWALSHGASTTSSNLPALDFDNDGAFSLTEAMYILQESAAEGINAGDPYWTLIAEWACDGIVQPARCQQLRNERLNPSTWRVTVLVETVLAFAPLVGQGLFAPTNVIPAVRLGDFNGDGFTSMTDARTLIAFIDLYDQDPTVDAGPADGDDVDDDAVHIIHFGLNFSIFDVNYDGVVDGVDLSLIQQDPGDYDNDDDVDLRDFVMLGRCFGGNAAVGTLVTDYLCLDAFDLDGDLDIDLADYGAVRGFASAMTGPLP